METLNFSSVLEAHVVVFAICILTGFVFYKLGEKYIPKKKRYKDEKNVLIKNYSRGFKFNVVAHIVFTLLRAFFLSLPIALAVNSSIEALMPPYVELAVNSSIEALMHPYVEIAFNIIACFLFITACCSVATGINVSLQFKKEIISPNLCRWYFDTYGSDYAFWNFLLFVLLLFIYVGTNYLCCSYIILATLIFYGIHGGFSIDTFFIIMSDRYVPPFSDSWD